MWRPFCVWGAILVSDLPGFVANIAGDVTACRIEQPPARVPGASELAGREARP